MGIIIKQSIKGSIWSYAGVAIGFVTTSFLFPRYLETDTIGLFSILLSYSILFAQFSALGLHGITTRLFPYFRSSEKNHNGYTFIAFVVMICGFFLFLLAFYFLKPALIESNLEKSKLFADYLNLLVPLTFFTLLFVQLDMFNKVLYDAVLGTFLQEFFQRVLIFSVTVLFVFQILSLNQLVIAYASVVCVKGTFMFVYLLVKGEISFKPQLKYIDKKLKKEMISVALFSVLTGLGGSIVFNIDKIIINQILGLGQTGVYTIAFFFGTLVVIPSRPLLRISGTLIADAFKRNDIEYISDIYKRSCLNQFIIGAFLFGGIWINIDNILQILGPDYADGKWVIFFIALSYLFDMLTGANGQIIAFSPYYRYSLYFILILVVLVVASMFIFVPKFGIVGGAIAISISIMVNNLMRFIFLKVNYRMQPFNWRFFVICTILIVAYLGSTILPEYKLILDILIRSIVFAIVFILGVYITNVSTDINITIHKLLKSTGLKKNF
jgi:O-antigen/teichoic acid export membrane protein